MAAILIANDVSENIRKRDDTACDMHCIASSYHPTMTIITPQKLFEITSNQTFKLSFSFLM